MLPERSYFCRFTFGQFFALVVLEIFTLFFIFYLGAQFGNQFFQTPQAGVPPEKGNAAVANTTQDPHIQALAKELIQASPSPDLKQRVSDLLERNAPQDFAPKAAAPAPFPTVAAPVVVAPATSETSATSAGEYTIQVGSYPTSEEAQSKINWWQVQGFSAYQTTVDLPERGRWYRVRIGTFANKEEAQTELEAIKEKVAVDAIILKND